MTQIQHNKSIILVKFATYASVAAAFTIIIAKYIGWSMTSSLTLMASLADSVLDIITSTINLIAVHYASKPADNEHRFGHGKAEDLSVFAQSVFFGFSGIFIAFESVKRLFYPETVEHSDVGILVMVFSIFITLLLISFQKYVINKTKSNIIKADHLHYVSDLLLNLSVIVSLFLTVYYELTFIDSLMALGISAYIMRSAFFLLRKSFNNLMDHELEESQRLVIINILKRNNKIKGFHDLRTRRSGDHIIIQLHIEMDGSVSLFEAHNVAVEIENDIVHAFPGADIIIHQDPEGIEEKVRYN